MYSLIISEKEYLVYEQSTKCSDLFFISMCIINVECKIIENSYELKTIFLIGTI